MVDAQRLARILTRIRQDLVTLRGYAEADRGEVRHDPAQLGHVKYLFVTLMEGCIDAAQHVCASEGFGPPESNAHAILLLAGNGLIPDDLAEAVADGARFRNVLVHLYAEVDDDRVVAHLDHLDDVERYVAALTALLDRDEAT